MPQIVESEILDFGFLQRPRKAHLDALEGLSPVHEHKIVGNVSDLFQPLQYLPDGAAEIDMARLASLGALLGEIEISLFHVHPLPGHAVNLPRPHSGMAGDRDNIGGVPGELPEKPVELLPRQRPVPGIFLR